MSARTGIISCAKPGRTMVRRIPSACEARSRSNMAAAARSASSCASSAARVSVMGLAPGECGGTGSVTAETRRALGGKGGDALGVVLRAAELALVVALDVELCGERAPQAFVDGLLGTRQTAGGGGGKVSRQVLDDAGKLGVLDAAPDQAPVRRLLRGELVAEEGESQRAGRPHEARQEPGAAGIRHQAEPGE